ncbi:MAG TPA: TadE/TadG family type IV pilus assembly protein [Candidatus Limnocylindrales bacterium]|nr:TadE/TadG family type IV pilus assembly protein [Candidatus Limnocylindrales bacterium]
MRVPPRRPSLDSSPPAGRKGQQSQALIEFALVSPVLLLLLFGVIDLGRAVFYYDMLNHAAREGARTAVRASNQLPTNADVLSTVSAQMLGAPVSAPCPQGPVTTATPPANSAWLYITEPSPPTTVETSPPPNAPGGQYAALAVGSCSAVSPASGNDALQVTLRFNLVLITPIVAQATANHVVISAAAVFRTEY